MMRKVVHTQSLIRISCGRVNRIRYRCSVTLDGDLILPGSALVVVVHRVASWHLTAGHIVLLLVLIVG